MSENKTIIIEKKFREVLPFTLVLVHRKGKDLKKMLKKASKKYKELKDCPNEDMNSYMAFVYSAGSNNIFLFFTDDFYSGTLAHECVHIVFYIFERLGIKISSDSEEVFAYLMDTVYSYVYDTCKTLGLQMETQKWN